MLFLFVLTYTLRYTHELKLVFLLGPEAFSTPPASSLQPLLTKPLNQRCYTFRGRGREPKFLSLAGKRGTMMRVLKILCPECASVAAVKKTNRKHPKLSDVYCYCSNVECGHTFVMNICFSHTISPSALSCQGRVKELMDALPPDERQKELELLLEAQGR